MDRFRRALAVMVALLPVLALIGCGGGGGDEGGGRIAFERGDPASPSVFVMNDDGANQQFVISNGRDPALRRDGRAIAFARDRDIFLVNVDGTTLTNLTNNNGLDAVASKPAYSALADKIAYVLTPNPRNDDEITIPTIHVMDADGMNDVQVVIDGDEPAFSPDGNHIVFVNGPDLFTINIDGTELIQLTFHNINLEAHRPSFTPFGDRIIYEFSPSPSIRAVTPGSLDEEVLVDSGSGPALSPFANRIAFARGGSIFTTNIIGTDLKQLTTGPSDRHPSWSAVL